MSKKTIAFQVPRKDPASRGLALVPAPAAIEAEHWVSRIERPAEIIGETPAPKCAPRAATITLAISAEPDLFEAASIGLWLPAAAFWLWGLAATRKSLQLFTR
jgi:hypothetical protein